MEKRHGCQHGNRFCYGTSLEVKFLEQPQPLIQEIWSMEKSSFLFFFIFFYFLIFLFVKNCCYFLSAKPTVASN
jgi:hypothetical protein